MTIFLRELVRNRKSFIIWLVSLVALNALMILMYPSIASQAEKFDEMIKNYPQGLVQAFGMDRLSFGNILHYYGTEAYLFITLFGSIFAMILGAGIISKEESDKTIEFLLAKPVTRNTIITSKVLAAFFYIVLFNLIFALINLIMFQAVKPGGYDMTGFILVSVGPLLLHLIFASIGLLISVFVVKAKAVYPISIGAVLGAYFLSIAASVSDKLDNIKYVTPFKYFEAADLILDEKIKGLYLAVTFIIIVSTVGLTYLFYNRKNISV